MPGSATAVIGNPVWVLQTMQETQAKSDPATASTSAPSKAPGAIEMARYLYRKDGLSAFWRGIGPALVLVVNPVLQYTVFEHIKNLLIKRRKAKLTAAGVAVTAAALLSDWDFFFLGALSKLSELPCSGVAGIVK